MLRLIFFEDVKLQGATVFLTLSREYITGCTTKIHDVCVCVSIYYIHCYQYLIPISQSFANLMYVCMYGWMDGWMEGRKDGRMCGCMDVWMYGCMHVCMNGCMHVCMNACVHECMCACMHVCMHACMHVCMHVCMYLHTWYGHPSNSEKDNNDKCLGAE